jgi:AraC family ethanolamine operon transcriptional activator
MTPTGGRRRISRNVRTSRQEVVERAEAYMRANAGAHVPVSRLCHIVGISERSLRDAFYGVRGMSPKRCLLAERLQDVRRALTDSDVKPATVTSIAADHGFHELGRFAGIYRQTFGEPPSATLRRAYNETLATHTSSTKGHVDADTS